MTISPEKRPKGIKGMETPFNRAYQYHGETAYEHADTSTVAAILDACTRAAQEGENQGTEDGLNKTRQAWERKRQGEIAA